MSPVDTGYAHRICGEYELHSFLQQYEVEQVAATGCTIEPSAGIVIRDRLSIDVRSRTMIHHFVRMITETDQHKHQTANKPLHISQHTLAHHFNGHLPDEPGKWPAVVVIAQQLFFYRQLSSLMKSVTTAELSHRLYLFLSVPCP